MPFLVLWVSFLSLFQVPFPALWLLVCYMDVAGFLTD